MNDFWNLNPKYMYIYQEAYIAGKKKEMEMIDASAFLHGIYVRSAVASCFNKKAKYPKKPLSCKNAEQERLQDMTEEEYNAEMRSVIAQMNKKFIEQKSN